MSQPFQFASRELDSETGLYYNRARYYDPELMRFISEDPAGLSAGINPFSYANNDPANLVDPSGLEPCKAELLGAGYTDDTDRWSGEVRCVLPTKFIWGNSGAWGSAFSPNFGGGIAAVAEPEAAARPDLLTISDDQGRMAVIGCQIEIAKLTANVVSDLLFVFPATGFVLTAGRVYMGAVGSASLRAVAYAGAAGKALVPSALTVDAYVAGGFQPLFGRDESGQFKLNWGNLKGLLPVRGSFDAYKKAKQACFL